MTHIYTKTLLQGSMTLQTENEQMQKLGKGKGDKAERGGGVLKKMKKKGKPEGGTGWGTER